LADAGIIPDASDACFSTSQILCSFLGADLKQEKIKEAKARTEGILLKNKKLRGNVVEVKELERSLLNLFTFLRQEILGNADLTDQAKRSLLSHLKEFRPPGRIKISES
jgi:hypothetical protein